MMVRHMCYTHECSSLLLCGILLRGHKPIIEVTQKPLQTLTYYQTIQGSQMHRNSPADSPNSFEIPGVPVFEFVRSTLT